jgi:hypothetical protein
MIHGTDWETQETICRLSVFDMRAVHGGIQTGHITCDSGLCGTSENTNYSDTSVLAGDRCRARHSTTSRSTYNIPIVLAGAQRYRYRGAAHIAGGGSIEAIDPGEVHTGERAGGDGSTYRASCPPVKGSGL